MKPEDPTIHLPLSNDELSTISDALIALIENENRAVTLVNNEFITACIKGHITYLASLNAKICSYMSEEKQEETK